MTNFKTEIKWAGIFIAVMLIWMLLENLSGLHSTYLEYHPMVTMFFMIPAFAVYILALRDKKQNDLDGHMTFGQGFKAGMIISIIITILSPLTQWIISYVITPEFFPNVIEYSLETGYHENRAAAEAYFSYKNYAIQSTVWALISGVLTSALVTLFMRSKTVSNKEALDSLQ